MLSPQRSALGLLLLLTGCRCGPADPLAAQSMSIDVNQLRSERPLLGWLAIHMKRHQLIQVRLLRGDDTMCPPARAADSPRATGHVKDIDLKKVAQRAVEETIDMVRALGPWRVRAPPLHLAALLCQPDAIEVLVKQGASAASTDDSGMTALHWATCDEAVAALLRAGADVNAPSRDALTPLHMAVDVPIVEALVKAGARVDASDACGNRPLHTASYFNLRFDADVRPPADANPNIAADNPLWLRALAATFQEVSDNLAAIHKRFDVAGALVRLGANPSTLNSAGHVGDALGGGGGDD